jgi:sortase B
MRKKIVIILVAALTGVAALCGGGFFNAYADAQNEIREYADVQDSFTSLVTYSSRRAQVSEPSETEGLPYVVADFDSLVEINPETVGWVAIPGSLISYPVMHTDSNTKYLKHSSNGTMSSAGAVFIDKNNAVYPLDKNTVLYGHNMGNGRTDMFSALLDYNDPAHYETHKFIQFDTARRQYGWWKIFAVINLDVKGGDFHYLRLDFTDNKEFAAWVKTAKELSLYDTGVAVAATDTVLTLSTCDRTNYGRNGRMMILAKLYKEN